MRSTGSIPPAFLKVCRGVAGWLFGLLYECPALDTSQFDVPFENTALSGQVVRNFEWLGIQRSVEVGGVTQPAARQQGVPWNDAAAPPTQLDIKSLRIGARCVEHQQ